MISGLVGRNVWFFCMVFQASQSNQVSYSDAQKDDFFGVEPLTFEQASLLRQSHKDLPLTTMVLAQLIFGLVLACVVWVLSGQSRLGWSVFYGALAVVVPAAFFARALTRRSKASSPGGAMAALVVWEFLKVILTVAMLFAAPRLVAGLDWLALVAGFVLTMKAYWFALGWHWVRRKQYQ